ETELAASAQRDLELDLPPLLPLREQLVRAELLERNDLELRRVLAHTRDLERVQDHDAPVALLRVQKRIGNCDGHLVPQRGRADGVAVDQNLGHGTILTA